MRITVYCGSRPGRDPAFMTAAYALGKGLGERGHSLVYGGAKVGLMGEVARGALDAKAHVTGIIPTWLVSKEIAHDGLPDLRIVPSMHERKAAMETESDAFVALPGGFGTFEELFEMITWSQIGLHAKAIGILNVNGFYDALLAFIRVAVDQQFVAGEHERLFTVATDPGALLDAIEAFVPPPLGDPALDRRGVRPQGGAGLP